MDRSKLTGDIAQTLQMVLVSRSTMLNFDHSLLDSFLDLSIGKISNAQPAMVRTRIRRLKVAVTMPEARGVVSSQQNSHKLLLGPG